MTFPLDHMDLTFKGSPLLLNPCRYWIRPIRSRLIYTVPGYDIPSDWLQFTEKKPKAGWSWFTPEEILRCFSEQGYSVKHVVITGGEPCEYDLMALSQSLIAHGYRVQIETSGTQPIRADDRCWVTVSPKIRMAGGYSVLPEALNRANEIKHPVATAKNIAQLDELLAGVELSAKVVCLQPISQKSRATELAMEVCIQRNWRLSVQLHKYLNIE